MQVPTQGLVRADGTRKALLAPLPSPEVPGEGERSPWGFVAMPREGLGSWGRLGLAQLPPLPSSLRSSCCPAALALGRACHPVTSAPVRIPRLMPCSGETGHEARLLRASRLWRKKV